MRALLSAMPFARLGHMLASCLLAVGVFAGVWGALHGLAAPRPAQAQVGTYDSQDGQHVQSVFNVDASQFPTLTADVYLVNGVSRPLATAPNAGLVAALMQDAALVEEGVSKTVRAIDKVTLPRRLVVIWDVVEPNPASFQEVCLGLRQAFGEVSDNERIAVITTTDGLPQLEQSLTSNREALQSVAPRVRRATSTRSEMYDALMLALSQTVDLPNTSRAIVVVSDEGGDWRPAQAATKPISNVVNRARELGVSLHLILHKPGLYSDVISQAIASTGGLVQVIPAKRDKVTAAVDGVREQMNQGFFHVTVMGNPALVRPGITHTLALAVPGEPRITGTHDFVHSHLFFAVQGLAPSQVVIRGIPLSVTFAITMPISPPFPLAAASMDLHSGAGAINLTQGISPNLVLTDFWISETAFTPTNLISLTESVTLQVRITDVRGNSGMRAVSFVVPPPFIARVANTPTRLTEYSAFTPTLWVQPDDWLNGKNMTVIAEVVFDDSSRTGKVYSVTQGQTLLPVPGERMSFGTRKWRVRLRDNFGRVFESSPQSVTVDSAPWMLTFFKWALGLLGLLAALGLLIGLALRLSRKKTLLVLENRGNATCAYDVQVTNAAGLFGFELQHGGYALQRHYQTELIKEPATHAAAANAPTKKGRPTNENGSGTPSTPKTNPPPQRSAAQSAAQATSAIANRAGGAAGKLASLGMQVPGLRGVLGGTQQRLRDVEMQTNAANFQVQRAASLAEKANELGGSNPTRIMPTDADESWQPSDVVPPKPTPQAARWVQTGPPWWRTPEIAPGQTQELSLLIRPDWPFVHRTCDAVLCSRPVLATSQQAGPAIEPGQMRQERVKETAIEVPMPRGMRLVLELLALAGLMALVIVLFVLYVWPCLVGNCLGG